MSLKLIELQVALPRTLEAGKLQEQIQHQGTLLQEQAAQSVKREEQKQRTTVLKADLKDVTATLKDQKGKSSYYKPQNQKKKKDEQNKKENHPYKGTNIDYSG